ncbi:WXG100 family type VII secretion target [Serinibacter arcticus]|uniref:ESAT-6-like protein n=1 Tax=Serinibacter arcticus TaxID=1655435 RepID=A0A2U1ZU66_9MICO|nr:WXG100 family type VII secretion target [Serinibacter arcticus]PWD50524.1 WXG100 family type VII secretion target [Serinibacter arcticus]
MGNSGITVGFSALETASGDITTGANGIASTLADLEGKLKNLEADWDGDAKEAYRVAQAQWNGALEDMKALLLQVGTTVTNSHDAYKGVEGKAAAAWQ